MSVFLEDSCEGVFQRLREALRIDGRAFLMRNIFEGLMVLSAVVLVRGEVSTRCRPFYPVKTSNLQ